MKNILVAMAALLLSTAALADDAAKTPDAAKAPDAAKPAKKSRAARALTAAEMKFAAPPNMTGVQIAPISGDATKGAYESMVKFAAGTKHPLHTHTNGVEAVVISGTWYSGPDDATAKDFGPGSFVLVPGGMKHVSGCRDGAECLIFQEGHAKFDMMPAGGADGAKPADAAKGDEKKADDKK